MPMHVIFLEPAFPGNQREFVRALHTAGALVSAIGTAPVQAFDHDLRTWLYGYEQVSSTASVDAADDFAVYTGMARPTAFTAGNRCAASVNTSTIPALPAVPRSAPATTRRTLSARAGEL